VGTRASAEDLKENEITRFQTAQTGSKKLQYGRYRTITMFLSKWTDTEGIEACELAIDQGREEAVKVVAKA
jgi:hypothetical protein